MMVVLEFSCNFDMIVGGYAYHVYPYCHLYWKSSALPSESSFLCSIVKIGLHYLSIISVLGREFRSELKISEWASSQDGDVSRHGLPLHNHIKIATKI